MTNTDMSKDSDSGQIITSSDILLHDAETALLYEELRAAIDDGHESMTHADALAEIAAIRAENEKLHAELAAIGAGGVNGPLMGQPQAMPDLSALTERGAKAWAGVDAQALREGADISKEREALEAYLKDCDKCQIVPDVGGAWHAAFQAGRASLPAAGQEPVAWMWQHDETGRTGFVDCWQVENGWQAANPRLKLVRQLYAAPQPAAPVAGQEPVTADALAPLRGAFAPFAQEPEWTTEHSMKYPSKAAQIINAVRDLLASAPQTGAKEQSEWDIRGHLAAKLTCWHRLTGNEAAELVALAKSWSAPQPAVAAGWIGVKDRLPEAYVEVLLVLDGKHVTTGEYMHSLSCFTWEPHDDELDDSKVTHWQPLPPAPSTEGESNG